MKTLQTKIIIFLIIVLIGQMLFSQYKISKLINLSNSTISELETLKKSNHTLYEKTISANKELSSLRNELSNYGKKMITRKDLAGFALIEGTASDTITGTSNTENDTITINVKEDGFCLTGWVNYITGKWFFKHELCFTLEAFAIEIMPGIYKTSLNTNDPNIKISKFDLRVTPYKPNWYTYIKPRISICSDVSFDIGVIYKDFGAGYRFQKDGNAIFVSYSPTIFR